jgi:hypothetical protein
VCHARLRSCRHANQSVMNCRRVGFCKLTGARDCVLTQTAGYILAAEVWQVPTRGPGPYQVRLVHACKRHTRICKTQRMRARAAPKVHQARSLRLPRQRRLHRACSQKPASGASVPCHALLQCQSRQQKRSCNMHASLGADKPNRQQAQSGCNNLSACSHKRCPSRHPSDWVR